MRPLLPKTLILFTSSSFSQARAHLFHSSSSSPSPYSSSSYSSYPYSRRHDEESRNVRVSVWWDFENCHLPSGVNLCKIAPSITEAVRANGIKGPVHITAFGDVLQLSKANQEALAYTGIHLTHIPNGGKNSADRSLLVDLMYWVSQNPPPAHLFLISGDKDFAGILHRLRMNNYNILLAIPGRAPDVLCSAATIMWQWSSLLKGEDLTGKHFNHPPDGPFSSWYGNYKVPLESPFSPVEHSTSSQTVEIYEPTSDSKPGFIPKSVLRQIRHILSSHPKGISITDFRTELAKSDVCLDKNLYGYKKFSRFLLAIPYIELKPLGEGKFSVRLLSESPESSENTVLASPTSDVKNVERGYAATPKLNAENMARDADRKQSIASLHQRDADPKSFQQVPSLGKPIREYVDVKLSHSPLVERHASQPPNELQNSSLGSEKVVGVADAQLSEIKLPPKDNELPKTKTCSSKIRLKQSPDNDIVRSEDVSHKIPEKYTVAGNGADENHYITVENNCIANDKSEKFKAEDKYEKSTRKEADEVCRSLSSLPADDSVVDKEPVTSAKPYSKSPTFLSWIRSWWPFSKSSAKSDDLTGCEDKMVSHSEEPKLSKPDKTVSHSEEPMLSKLDKTVSRSEEPMLSELDQTVSRSEEAKLSDLNQTVSHSEEPKLSELDQTVSRSEETKSSEMNQTVSHSEEPKLSELDKTVIHSEEPNLSELDKTVSHSEEPKLSELDKTVSHSEETKLSGLGQNVSHSGRLVLFSCDSFWRNMESFVFSPKGSLLFSQSRSREDLTHKLQKDGPLFLRSHTEEDILRLVDLLIAEKKWLEESPIQSFPFRLTQPVQKGSLMGQSHGANGLRSLFLSTTPQSSLQKSLEHDVEKQNQSTPHTGVSTPATESKYPDRSRNDVLVDCQTLVKEILRDHPEGYNIGSFRKLFLDRYGYHLDVQKLGYQKLTSLLQMMPGAKLESTYIFPSVPAVPTVCASDEEAPILKTQVTNASNAVSNSDSELSDSAPKDDDSDSPWEELGPVSTNNSNHSVRESKLSQKDKELYTSKHRDYEPIISGDDSSESEDDDPYLTQPEEQKPKCNEHDSSFWQALDLWHNSKEGGSSVKKSDNLDTLSNSLVDILNSTPESTQGALSKIPPGNFREKQRSQKTYSFVADPVLPNNKEKLIDGILDGFKKAEESKMQN